MIERHRRRAIRDESTERLPRIKEKDLTGGGYSSSDIRKDIAALFSPEPLVKPTDEEIRLLKRLYKESMLARLRSTIRAEDVSLVSGYSSYENFRDAKIGPGSRDTYGDYIDGAFKECVEEKLKKQKKVEVVDFGAARCEFISGMRDEFGADRLHATATSLEYCPHKEVDGYVLAPFEWLPKDFEGRFDVGTSNFALDYCYMPHLGVRGICKSLAKGGEALVSIGASRVPSSMKGIRYFGVGEDGERAYTDYLESQVPWDRISEANRHTFLQQRLNVLLADEFQNLARTGFEIKPHIAIKGVRGLTEVDVSKLGADNLAYYAHIRRKQ